MEEYLEEKEKARKGPYNQEIVWVCSIFRK